MSGPWEDYQGGPWLDYAKPETPVSELPTSPSMAPKPGWKVRDYQEKYGPIWGTTKAVLEGISEEAPKGDDSLSPGYMAVKAGRNIVSGLSQLPADLGIDTEATRSAKAFGAGLPEMPTAGVGNDIGSLLLQYGAPATLAAKGVGALTGADAATKLGQIGQYFAKLLGAATTDAAVTDPQQAATIGDVVSGPTDIQPSDSDLAKRAKVGAETLAIAPAVDAGLRSTYAVGKGGLKMVQNAWEGGRRLTVGEGLAKAGVTEDVAKQAAPLTEGGFTPRTSDVVNTPEIQMQARGVQGEPTFIAANQKNERAIGDNFGKTLDSSQGAQPDVTQKFFADQRQGMTQAADQGVESAAQRKAAADAALAQEQGAVTAAQNTTADASAGIDTAVRGAEKKVMDVQRGLYGQATSGDTVVPTAPFHDAAQKVLADIGTLGEKDAGLASIVRDIEKLAPPRTAATADLAASAESGVPVDFTPGKTGTVPFSELIDIRTRLTRMMSHANRNLMGGVEENLGTVKSAVDAEINRLAAEGNPQAIAAVKGREWHQAEVAPRFRTGPGGQWDQAARGKTPTPPTQTGSMFLRPDGTGGAREAAGQLDLILKQAPNEAAGREAARKYLVGSLADTMTGGKIDAGRLDKWMADHSEALKLVPEARVEIQQMRNRLAAKSDVVGQMEREVQAASEARDAMQKALADDPTAYWIGKKPDDAIRDVLQPGNAKAAEQMRALAAAARKDSSGKATEGLKNAVKDALNRDIRNPGAALPGGDNSVAAGKANDWKPSLAKANALLADGSVSRKALEQVFTPEEMAKLDLYRKQLEVNARISGTRTTAGSDTSLNESAMSSPVALARGATLIGTGKVQGGMLIRALEMFNNRVLGGAKVKDLRIRALTDPELAGILVMKYNQSTKAVVERKLHTYITNNLTGAQAAYARNNDNQD